MPGSRVIELVIVEHRPGGSSPDDRERSVEADRLSQRE
jgi:hypothetical protein